MLFINWQTLWNRVKVDLIFLEKGGMWLFSTAACAWVYESAVIAARTMVG